MKRYAITFFMLFSLAVAILVLLLATVLHPNRWKPMIAAEIQKETGQSFTMIGDLSWSLTPFVGIKAAHLQLRDAKKTVIDAENVAIRFPLASWLRGHKAIAIQTQGHFDCPQGIPIKAHFKLIGAGRFDLQATLRLGDRETLNGRGTLTVDEGTIEGVDVPHWVRRLSSFVRLHDFTTDFTIEKGRLKII